MREIEVTFALANYLKAEHQVKCQFGIVDLIWNKTIIEVKLSSSEWKSALGQTLAYQTCFPTYKKEIWLKGSYDISIIKICADYNISVLFFDNFNFPLFCKSKKFIKDNNKSILIKKQEALKRFIDYIDWQRNIKNKNPDTRFRDIPPHCLNFIFDFYKKEIPLEEYEFEEWIKRIKFEFAPSSLTPNQIKQRVRKGKANTRRNRLKNMSDKPIHIGKRFL